MPLFGKIVVIRRNGMDGSMFPLTFKKCVFGRATDCDIRVQLPKVADHHCTLELAQDGRFQISNLNDEGETILNKKPVEKNVFLQHKDVFTILDRSFRIEYPPGSGHDKVLAQKLFTPKASVKNTTPLRESNRMDSNITSQNMPKIKQEKFDDPFASLVQEMKKVVTNKNTGQLTLSGKTKRRSKGRRSVAKKLSPKNADENTPPECSSQSLKNDAENDTPKNTRRRSKARRSMPIKEQKTAQTTEVTKTTNENNSESNAPNGNLRRQSKGRKSIFEDSELKLQNDIKNFPSTENDETVVAKISSENTLTLEQVSEKRKSKDRRSSIKSKSSDQIIDVFESSIDHNKSVETKPAIEFSKEKPSKRHSISTIAAQSKKQENKSRKTRVSIAKITQSENLSLADPVIEKNNENHSSRVEESKETETKKTSNVEKAVFKSNKPKHRHSIAQSSREDVNLTDISERRASIAEIKYQYTESSSNENTEDEICKKVPTKVTAVFKSNKPKSRHSTGAFTKNAGTKSTRKSIAKIDYKDENASIKKGSDKSKINKTKKANVKTKTRCSIGSAIVKVANEGKRRASIAKIGQNTSKKYEESINNTKEFDPELSVSSLNVEVSDDTFESSLIQSPPKRNSAPNTPEVSLSPSAENETTSYSPSGSFTNDQQNNSAFAVYEFNDPDNKAITKLVDSIKKNRRQSSSSNSVGRKRALQSFGSPVVHVASPLRKSIGELRRKSVPLQEVSLEESPASEAIDNEEIEVENGTSPCKQRRMMTNSVKRSLRKRVSFGPALSPEEFVKALPSNTPVKRGSAPRHSSSKRGSLFFTPSNLATVEEGQTPSDSTPTRRISPRLAALQFNSTSPAFKSPLTPVLKLKKEKSRTPTPFRLDPSKVKGKSLLHQVLHAAVESNIPPSDVVSNSVGASPNLGAGKRKRKSGENSIELQPSPKNVKLSSPKVTNGTRTSVTPKASTTKVKTPKSSTPRRKSKQNIQIKNVHKTSANRINGKRPLWSDIVKKPAAETKKNAVNNKKTLKAREAKKIQAQNSETPQTPNVRGRRHVDSPATVYIGKNRYMRRTKQTPKQDEKHQIAIEEPKLKQIFDEMNLPEDTMLQSNMDDKKAPLNAQNSKNKQNSVENNFGTKRLLQTPRQPKDINTNKMSDKEVLQGVIRTTKTPKEKKESVVDNFGTKRLFNTPKLRQRKTQVGYTNLKGISKILKTPGAIKKENNKLNASKKNQTTPVQDKLGIKRLMQTPKDRSAKASVAVEDHFGTKRLLKTPKVGSNKSNETVEVHFGTKRLMQTPKDRSEKSDSTVEDHFGTKRIMKTPNDRSNKSYHTVEDHFGTKRLMQTPKDRSKKTNESVEDHFGTKRLLTTPKDRSNKPSGIVENKFGTKRLLQSPKERIHKDVETDLSGLQHIFKEKKSKNVAVIKHFGTKRLLTSPKVKATLNPNEFSDGLYLENLFGQEDVELNVKAEEVSQSSVVAKAKKPVKGKKVNTTPAVTEVDKAQEEVTSSKKRSLRNKKVEAAPMRNVRGRSSKKAAQNEEVKEPNEENLHVVKPKRSSRQKKVVEQPSKIVSVETVSKEENNIPKRSTRRNKVEPSPPRNSQDKKDEVKSNTAKSQRSTRSRKVTFNLNGNKKDDDLIKSPPKKSTRSTRKNVAADKVEEATKKPKSPEKVSKSKTNPKNILDDGNAVTDTILSRKSTRAKKSVTQVAKTSLPTIAEDSPVEDKIVIAPTRSKRSQKVKPTENVVETRKTRGRGKRPTDESLLQAPAAKKLKKDSPNDVEIKVQTEMESTTTNKVTKTVRKSVRSKSKTRKEDDTITKVSAKPRKMRSVKDTDVKVEAVVRKSKRTKQREDSDETISVASKIAKTDKEEFQTTVQRSVKGVKSTENKKVESKATADTNKAVTTKRTRNQGKKSKPELAPVKRSTRYRSKK